MGRTKGIWQQLDVILIGILLLGCILSYLISDKTTQFNLTDQIPQESLANIDIKNPTKPPLYRSDRGLYILGSDGLGRDLGVLILRGAGFSILLAFISGAIALLISLFLVYFIGLNKYKNKGLPWVTYAITCLCILLFFFYTYYYNFTNSFLFTASFIFCLYFILRSILAYKNGTISTITDPNVSRLIEIVNALPGILIPMTLVSMFNFQSLFSISLLLAIMVWPVILRLIRGELLAVIEKDFVKAGFLSAAPYHRIFFTHILPNIITPILVASCFMLNGLILLESILSFLGINNYTSVMTLGNLISQSRYMIDSWWMIVFPATMLFLILYFFSKLSKKISGL